MTTDAVNYHVDHPGFAGPIGLLVGLIMIVAGGAVARLAADEQARLVAWGVCTDAPGSAQEARLT